LTAVESVVEPGPLPLRTEGPGVSDERPLGIIVLNGSGGLVATNDEAVALAGSIPRRRFARPRVCCQLFGCRVAGTPLAELCLTERAVEEGEVPAVCVEPANGRPRPAVWVSASSARSSEPIVTLTVRAPAANGSSGRASEAIAGTLRIRALGYTRIEAPGAIENGNWLEQRAGQLLKFLVCHRGRPARSELIAEALWPELGVGAGANVRHFVRTLRNQLEPARPRGAPSSFVVASRGGYALASERVEVDADEFEQIARDGRAMFARGDRSAAKPLLERALKLYGGDFIADEPYAEWAHGERERLHELAADIHRMLAQMHADAGELEAAAGQAVKLARLEPWDTAVQRALLVVCLRRGRRSEAVRRYRHLEQGLRREFGDEPDFSLSDLRADHDLGLA
jgi:DNA-binding SARP family transcriptional activator